MSRPDPILKLPESVHKDVLGYRAEFARFDRGEMSPMAFKAYRVPMGVYEQREEGHFMVRVRIPAGLAWPYQMRRLAQLARRFGSDRLHVTTRQDIQIHGVRLPDTVEVQEGLLEVGLTARGGGGNTVRNVTACPRAGVCSDELFDVRPYAVATAEYLLGFASSYNLPRKFKIAFSCGGCDAAMAAVADLGFFARLRNGRQGFAVYGGGGLGSNPTTGVLLEEWVEADDFLAVVEAVKRLFDAHGDRSNKHAARLRYVVTRLGVESFGAEYLLHRSRVREEGLPGPAVAPRAVLTPRRRPPPGPAPPVRVGENVLPEKTSGFYTVRLNLALGDIGADDLCAVAEAAETFGEGLVRATQQQDLLVTGVWGGDVEKVLEALGSLEADVLGILRPSVVACAGASTCKLGLCFSRNLAEAIEQRLRARGLDGASLPPIRISGCPNSCGNHHAARIGLQGKARRVKGRLMPFYELFADADLREGEALLARPIGAVPARVVPDLLAEALSSGQVDSPGAVLERLIPKYAALPSEIPEEWFRDWGTSEPFSLAGRGPGECSVGVMDVMRVDIDTARTALERARRAGESQPDEAVYEAIIAAARALLPVWGLEPRKDRQVVSLFQEHLLNDGWVEPEADKLLEAALDWRMGDRDGLTDLAEAVEPLIERVADLFVSLDANLKFRIPPVSEQPDTPAHAPNVADASARTHPVEPPTGTESPAYLSDLRGVKCPMNFVKAKAVLETIPVGEVLDILLDSGDPVKNVPASFTEQGQAVLSVESEQTHFRVRVRREK